MEHVDEKKASAVWSRVLEGRPAPAPADHESLLELIAGEWTDGAVYLRLSRQIGGRDGAILRKMFDEEQAHAACLKGIYTLLTGKKPLIRGQAPDQGPLEATLRKCYGREMRCLAEYERRAADPEYGPVFARLAAQEREHCRVVLELLGRR